MPTGTSIPPMLLFAAALGGFVLGSLFTLLMARRRPRAFGLTDRGTVEGRLQELQAELVAELKALEGGGGSTMSRPRPAPPIRMVPQTEGEARREAA
jgi:hypothetical protein